MRGLWFSSLYRRSLPKMNKTQVLKQQLKMLFATPQGWFSWFIANLITSSPWIITLVAGFLLKNPQLYAVSASIWTFYMLPVTPFWILNLAIAVFLRNKVIK
jgi:hypothetical protein